MQTFESFGLHQDILKAIVEAGFTIPFGAAIQQTHRYEYRIGLPRSSAASSLPPSVSPDAAATAARAAALGSQKSITCDEYSQKPYGPESIGGPGRTTDMSNLLEAHGLDGFNTSLVSKVEKAITACCGQTSLKGGVKAKRNNNSPIDNAVDWSTLTTAKKK